MASFTQRQRKHIATNIRKNIEKMNENGDSMQRFAREFNVSVTVVSQWMRGEKTPCLVHLYRMAKLFNMPLHQFCGLPKPSSKRTSELATDVIIKIASCKSQSGKTLFHNISQKTIDPAISLILNELQEIVKCTDKTIDE